MIAEQLLRQRDARSQIFGALREGHWMILLDLTVQESRGRRTTVGACCLASRSPATTALRYVADLDAEGWVERTGDDRDGRLVYVTLTDKARERMAEFVRRFGDKGAGDTEPRAYIDEHGNLRAPAGYAFVSAVEGVKMVPTPFGGLIGSVVLESVG